MLATTVATPPHHLCAFLSATKRVEKGTVKRNANKTVTPGIIVRSSPVNSPSSRSAEYLRL